MTPKHFSKRSDEPRYDNKLPELNKWTVPDFSSNLSYLHQKKKKAKTNSRSLILDEQTSTIKHMRTDSTQKVLSVYCPKKVINGGYPNLQDQIFNHTPEVSRNKQSEGNRRSLTEMQTIGTPIKDIASS